MRSDIRRKHSRIRFWSLSAVLLAGSVASAQQDELDFNFLGAGARANGMGDAFVAVADDATAIFWNPAGLFLLDRPEGSFGFQFSSVTFEQTPRRQTFLLTADEPVSSVDLNFASVVVPKRFGNRKLVFAFAVQKAFDFNAEADTIRALQPFVLQQERSRGGPFGYSGGVAFSPVQGLMLGLSVSVFRGSAETTDNQILTQADGLVLNATNTANLPINGTSVGLGALYDFQTRDGPPLRLGLKFVPGFDFSGDIQVATTLRVADSDGTLAEESAAAEFDYVLDFPLDLGLGLAWNPRRDLLIAADFEHRRFSGAAFRSSAEARIDDNGDLLFERVDVVDPVSDSGSDLNQWRVGFEWSWVNRLTVVPIRAGVKNLPQSTADERRFVDPGDGSLSTVFGDQVVGTAFTAGVGLVTDSFVFDTSMEYGGWRQKVIQSELGRTESRELATRRFSLRMSLILYF